MLDGQPFPEDWPRSPIYDLAVWTNGLAFRDFQFGEEGWPVIKIAELKDGVSGQTRFTHQTFDERYHVKHGDMLFSWSGNPDTSIDVFWWRGGDGWLNQHIFKVDPTDVNSRFFYYLLRYLRPTFAEIARNKQTTGLGHVTAKDLKSLLVGVPPLRAQARIAAILGSLDDKIELNRRMNHTLEKITQAIFRLWFVDLGPVRAKAEGRWKKGESLSGMPADMWDLWPSDFEESEIGEIPRGWNVEEVGSVIAVAGGSTPSTKDPRFWDGPIHWATPKDMAGLSAPVLLHTERNLTDVGLSETTSGLLPIGTVLLSSRAPIGYLAITEIPLAVNQGFITMTCGTNPSNHYMLHWARENHEAILAQANGTTFLEISKGNFRPMRILVPIDEVMNRFTKIAQRLHEQVVTNLRQIETLAAMRDSLLPRLLSGEIRVPLNDGA